MSGKPWVLGSRRRTRGWIRLSPQPEGGSGFRMHRAAFRECRNRVSARRVKCSLCGRMFPRAFGAEPRGGGQELCAAGLWGFCPKAWHILEDSIKPSVFKGRGFNGRRMGLDGRRGLCRAMGISTMKLGTLRLNSTTSCGGGGGAGPGGPGWQLTCAVLLGSCLPAPPSRPHTTSAGEIAPAGSGGDTSGSGAEAGRAGASPGSLQPVLGLSIICSRVDSPP